MSDQDYVDMVDDAEDDRFDGIVPKCPGCGEVAQGDVEEQITWMEKHNCGI